MNTDPDEFRARKKKKSPAGAVEVAPMRVLFGRSIDGLLAGGLSIAVAPLVLGISSLSGGLKGEALMTTTGFLTVNALINWPHIMASFGLLYGQREKVREHRLVAFGLPLILVLTLTGLLAAASVTVVPLQLATVFVAAYLAFHYTGQTFGTISCFSYLAGIRLGGVERRLLRTNLYALVAFHIMWLHRMFEPGSMPDELVTGLALTEPLVLALQPVGLGCGAFAFFRLYKHKDGPLPPRVWMPWIGVHFWYLLLFFEPSTLIIVQLLHASQYLLLSSRAEFNINELPPPDQINTQVRPRISRRLIYAVALLLSGLVPFVLFPGILESLLRDTLALPGPAEAVFPAVVLLVTFHHYVTDAVVWKLRDPRVRRTLFGHLSVSAI